MCGITANRKLICNLVYTQNRAFYCMLQNVIYFCDMRDVASGKLGLHKQEIVLFNDAVSRWDYIASHGRVINGLNGMNMEEVAVDYFKHSHWGSGEKHRRP
jgi:hypothetical protein